MQKKDFWRGYYFVILPSKAGFLLIEEDMSPLERVPQPLEIILNSHKTFKVIKNPVKETLEALDC